MGLQEWRTPPALFEALHSEFLFGVDVMATAEDALLPLYITPTLDALAAGTPWFAGSNRRVVRSAFCNPGFGRLKETTKKAFEEVQKVPGSVAVVVALCNPSTVWWRHAVVEYPATEIRLLGGQRVAFIDPRTGAPGKENSYENTVLVYRANPMRRAPHIWTWYWRGEK